MVLNHGSTMGTGLLTAPSGLYLNFFLPAAPFFLFCSAKKDSMCDSVLKKLDFYTVP